ncbi:hypothetical protein AKJ16_DCAP20715 [Drosera capensis]
MPQQSICTVHITLNHLRQPHTAATDNHHHHLSLSKLPLPISTTAKSPKHRTLIGPMRRQIPLDLIHRLQISLRADSNLKFPSHSDPANLPSLEEFIADFDSDDGGVRCGGCKGRLLRGTESMICVYCGRGLGDVRESKPENIEFIRTVGFRWLLESLGLDGSEMVTPTADDSQSNRRKSSQNAEVPLSEFLNFEIEWPDDSERFGVALEHEVEVPGKKLLHLAGVELGCQVPGSTVTSGASSEQILPRDTFTPIESAVLQRQGSFDSSKNELPAEASEKLDTVEEADSFSGWEADFQSASSDPQRLDVESSEFSLVQVVDYGSHTISAYENAEAAIEGSAVDASASQASGSTRISNEHWGNPIGETLSGKSEVMTAHKEDTTFSRPESTSARVEWFENQQKTSSIEVPASGKLVGEELDGGRKGSNDAEDNQWGTVYALIPGNVKQSLYDGSLDDWDDFAGSSAALGNPGQESSLQGDGNDPLDAWDGFKSSSRPQDNQLSSRTKDGTGNLGDYSDDLWNSFTSFASMQENQQAVLHDQIQFDPLGLEVHHFGSPAQPDYFQASTSKSVADNEPIKDESPFDLWNALQSSSHKRDTKGKNNHIEVADNKMGGVQNVADDWGDFVNLGEIDSKNSTSLFENKGDGDEVESFDAWNEFASSTNGNDKATAEDSKSGTWNNVLISNSVHLKNGEQTSESKMSIEEDAILDSWGDFRSSGNVVDNSSAISNTSFGNGKVSEDIFSNSVPLYASMQNSDQRDNVPNHDDPLNEWSDFGSLAHVSDKVSPVIGSMGTDSKILGEGDNMFDRRVQSTAETSDNQLRNDGAAARHDTSEDLDTNYAWTDFSSSKVVEGDHGLGSTNVYSDRGTINCSDPFDSWNMFVSSSSQTGDLTEFPTTHLASSISNSHDVNSISSQPDPFLGAFNNLNGITKSGVSLAEDPAWFWTKNENAEAKSKTIEIPTSQGSGEVSVSKSNDIESLISQMHDISFMLGSSLSIPKR